MLRSATHILCQLNRRLKSTDVIDVLSDLFILRGVPAHIRSDDGPELVAKAVSGLDPRGRREDRLHHAGQPLENGYIESFNARLCDELLNGALFFTLREARIVIESWRRQYNAVRPHSSLGYRAPAPEVAICPAPPHGGLRSLERLRRPCFR